MVYDAIQGLKIAVSILGAATIVLGMICAKLYFGKNDKKVPIEEEKKYYNSMVKNVKELDVDKFLEFVKTDNPEFYKKFVAQPRVLQELTLYKIVLSIPEIEPSIKDEAKRRIRKIRNENK